jgi:SAM-dependent methyltransferase
MCRSTVRAAAGTRLQLVRRPCPVCGGEESAVVYPRRRGAGGFGYCARKLLRPSSHFAVAECSSCSMVYANPRPSGADLRRTYRSLADEDYAALSHERIEVFRTEVGHLARWVRSPGKLLDIGCAYGYFLDAAATAGWKTYGVEISEQAGAVAAAKGHRVVVGELETAGWPEESFRVITLWDVLEHVDSPGQTLLEVARLLEPGGLAVVMTPDLSSSVARLLGERWWSVVEMHLHYFTPKTLQRILRESGLLPVARATYPKRITMGYAARWIRSWGVPGSLLARLIDVLGLQSVTLSLDPRDQMKVYARKV